MPGSGSCYTKMKIWLIPGLLILIKISVLTYLFWFARWWTQFGPITDIFLRPLIDSFKYFTSVYKTDPHGAKFPLTLHFVKKYKVPWILNLQYVKEMEVLTWQWFVKWWDKFFHTQDVIDNVTREFPAVNTITHDKAQAPTYPLVQIAMP